MEQPGPPSEPEMPRDQVQFVQGQRSEPRRPWMRWATGLTSVIALFVSGVTGVYTLRQEETRESRTKKEEFRRLIISLVELREEFDKRVRQIKDPQLRQSSAALLDFKRMIYLESAEQIAAQIPNHVSSSEYSVLAEENIFISNFPHAERYYVKAINAATTPLSKAVSLRTLAGVHFARGPLYNLDKGREYFRQAIEVLSNPTDDYSLYHLASTFEQWGLTEINGGFEREGEQKIDRARMYYTELPSDFPFRSTSLKLLEKRTQQTRKTTRH